MQCLDRRPDRCIHHEGIPYIVYLLALWVICQSVYMIVSHAHVA